MYRAALLPRSTALLLRQLTGPAAQCSPTLLRWPATAVTAGVAAASLHSSSVWRCEKAQTAVGEIIIIIILGKKMYGFDVGHYCNFIITLRNCSLFSFNAALNMAITSNYMR
jgi:hypothetical protein